MGLFEKLFPKKEIIRQANDQFKLLDAYRPTWTTWCGAIYESELVRSSVDAISRNISKLDVHILGAAQPTLQTKLRKAPNRWQTWSQFMSRLAAILYCDNTAFIVPVEDKYGSVTGVYAIKPEKWELVAVNNEPYLRFTFAENKRTVIELSKVGIMTRFQYKSDLFGETNQALIPTMELISIQNQGIQEGVKAAATFRFMAKYTNFAFADNLKAERQRFNEENLASDGGGILLFPNTYSDIKQIESKPFVVSAEQMSAIEKNVFNYFGTNENILQNKAYGDDWSAFYEGAIEPFAIQFSEVLTKMLFTEKEQSQGARIIASANRLQYMSNADKLAFTTGMADRGMMTRNEMREIWNLPPLPEDIGETIPARGEYYNVGENEESGATTSTKEVSSNGTTES